MQNRNSSSEPVLNLLYTSNSVKSFLNIRNTCFDEFPKGFMMHETKRGEHYPVVHPKVSDGLVHALAQDTERKRD